jgi:acetyltransferase
MTTHPVEPPTTLQAERSGLDAIFDPKAIALIGATDRAGAVGRILLENLIQSGYGRTVYPINPKRTSVLGVRAYKSVADVPDQLDMAVIVTPSKTVPSLVKQCGEVGIKGIIIISAGFKEIGPEGVKLEEQILAEARSRGMRIIGPNCLGVMNPVAGLNATFGSTIARPGKVAFLSQSGALCTAILDWSIHENVGFSRFVSMGTMLDVGWGDLIDYLGNDPETESILLYMESIGNARSFLSAAREVALTKPIILIKPGRSEAAAQAAVSHTGSLAGSDDALSAAFQRAGVLRVDRISELFNMAEVLSKQPLPKGNRLTIVTNAGGPGVLATDALVGAGGELAPISDATMDRLNELLPPAWSHGNPIDILGDAGPDLYRQSVEIAMDNPESDGMLVILTPQAMTDPTKSAEAIRTLQFPSDKPILTSWMGRGEIAGGESILRHNGIPTFEYPDTSVRAFGAMHSYRQNLRALYETPERPDWSDAQHTANYAHAQSLVQAAVNEGRTLLTTTADEAVKSAESIGYPVVLKLHSKTVTHKTDVGGVKLNLADEAAVRQAFESIRQTLEEKKGAGHFDGVSVQPMISKSGYELIIGSSIDTQLGPVLLFGSGGELVEVYRDRALGLPPLTSTLAHRMIERTTIYTALQGVRGRDPVDIAALAQVLVRFSFLVVDHPQIKEIDINPMLASPEGLTALDARVVLYSADEIKHTKLPKAAIRPYPVEYVWQEKLKDDTPVTVRPIRPEDEPLMVEFHRSLSERSVVQRYFYEMKLEERVTHERLVRVCHADYDREMVLVAEAELDGKRQILGVARLSCSRLAERPTAEFALIISDKHQSKGLGRLLLTRLVGVAQREGVEILHGLLLRDNEPMRKLCTELGFEFRDREDKRLMEAVMVRGEQK